jgi:hypothetical protein
MARPIWGRQRIIEGDITLGVALLEALADLHGSTGHFLG